MSTFLQAHNSDAEDHCLFCGAAVEPGQHVCWECESAYYLELTLYDQIEMLDPVEQEAAFAAVVEDDLLDEGISSFTVNRR